MILETCLKEDVEEFTVLSTRGANNILDLWRKGRELKEL
jgi:hypothetical protein